MEQGRGESGWEVFPTHSSQQNITSPFQNHNTTSRLKPPHPSQPERHRHSPEPDPTKKLSPPIHMDSPSSGAHSRLRSLRATKHRRSCKPRAVHEHYKAAQTAGLPQHRPQGPRNPARGHQPIAPPPPSQPPPPSAQQTRPPPHPQACPQASLRASPQASRLPRPRHPGTSS